MRAHRIVAVDIGAAHLAGGVFAARKGRLVLEHFAFESHHSDPAREGSWLGEVAESLVAATAQQPRLRGPCALAVPGHLVLTKSVRLHPPLSGQRPLGAFDPSTEIPHPLAEVVWDSTVVAEEDGEFEVLLSAIKLDVIEPLCAAAAAAGLLVECVLPSGCSLRQAFIHSHPDIQDAVMVANIGARSTNLLFLERGRFSHRTVPLAGNDVTGQIAGELQIDFAAAELLKVQVLSGQSDLPVGSPMRLAVQRAAADFAARLQLEVTRSAIHHRRQSGAGPAAALFLAGGGSLIEDLPEQLTAGLGLRVERFRPLRQVEVLSAARAADARNMESVLADLVGLATPLVSGERYTAGLLPPVLAKAAARRKRQPIFLKSGIALAVALIPPLVHFDSLVANRVAEVARLEAEIAPRRIRADRNAENLRKVAETMDQLDTLRVAEEARGIWIEFLVELQGRLNAVEDVWIERLQVIRPPAPATEFGQLLQPAGGAAAGTGGSEAEPIKIVLSGRLLDVANPQSRVSEEAVERVKRLLASFAESRFVLRVENERFEHPRDGVLGFDFTLLVNPERPL